MGGPLGELLGFADAVEVLAQHQELVPAEPGHGVHAADGLAEPIGDGDEHLVADVVSEAVVDELEPVEVQEQDGKGRRPPVETSERVREAVDDQSAVRQSGERVVHRQESQSRLGARAIDRDGGDVGPAFEQRPLGRSGRHRRGPVDGERREDAAVAGGADLEGPREVEVVLQRRGTDLGPERVAPDVLEDDQVVVVIGAAYAGSGEMARGQRHVGDGLEIARRHARREALAEGAGRRVDETDRAARAGQELLDRRDERVHRVRERCAAGNRLEDACLARLERFIALPFGHVAEVADDAPHRRLVEPVRTRRLDPPPAPVGVSSAGFEHVRAARVGHRPGEH